MKTNKIIAVCTIIIFVLVIFFNYADGLALTGFKSDYYDVYGARYYRVDKNVGDNFFDYLYGRELYNAFDSQEKNVGIPFKIKNRSYEVTDVVASHTCFNSQRRICDYIVFGRCKLYLVLKEIEE